MGARLNPRLREIAENAKLRGDISESFYLKNCKPNSMKHFKLWIEAKLREPKFYSSMVSEPDSRRISRIYGAFRHRVLKTNESLSVQISELMSCLQNEDYLAGIKATDLGPLLTMYKKINPEYMDWVRGNESRFVITKQSRHCTVKPLVVSFRYPLGALSKRVNSDFVVVCKHEPQYAKLFRMNKDPMTEVRYVDNKVRECGLEPDDLTAQQYSKIAKRISGVDKRLYYFVGRTASNCREITDYPSLISFISSNSLHGFEIKFSEARLSNLMTLGIGGLHVSPKARENMERVWTRRLVKDIQ
jgi:hypothetical protein